MKNFLAAFITIGTLYSLPALGADMPVKAPPPLVATASWTGFYVGGNFGYSWGDLSGNLTLNGNPIYSSSVNVDGVIGGGQIGYNWQTGNFVLSLEADIQASGQSVDATQSYSLPVAGAPAIPVLDSETIKLTYFGTVRGRLGYTQEGWLLFVTGGWAYGEETNNGTRTQAGIVHPFSISNFANGWTIGGGVEKAFDKNWSWKAEYLYVDLGNWNTVGVAPQGIIASSAKFTDNIFRLGVNYRF
jgi:outer membrane immunogenic protein